jgi:hypothetical protein
MKMYGRVHVWTHVTLNSALVLDEWSALRPGLFTSGERSSDTLWIGSWMHPRTGLNGEVNILDPTGTGTPTPWVVQPVASCYTDWLPRLLI